MFEWIQSLTKRQFVGTESRLLTIFTLLQNIYTQTMLDPEEQVNALEKQKAEIQSQIDKIKRGEQSAYDPTRIKEQFYQIEDTVRQLIGDFRQIEKNFRDLNAGTKQMIATSDLTKGKLLDQIFDAQDLIRDDDQGKSFAAFWELILSPESQEDLDEKIRYVYSLQEIKDLEPSPLVMETRHMLRDAGSRVYKSNSKLGEQLRRYLENKMYLEDRRIMELIKPIEKHAVELRNADIPRSLQFMNIPEIGVDVDLAMTRRLYIVPTTPTINSSGIIAGESTAADAQLLFEQEFIDREQIKDNILSALQRQSQISLNRLLVEYPLEYGVAELITYLDIAHTTGHHLIDPDISEYIKVERADCSVIVKMPRVIFVR